MSTNYNMLSIKKINNEKITVIPIKKVNSSEIKGYSIIPMLYSNIYICAQKRSGKTNIIFKIMKACIDKDTKVVVFCSTHDNDDNWKYIKKYLETEQIPSVFYSSLFEDKIDQLEVLMNFMKEESKMNEMEEEENKKKNINNLIEIVKFDKEKGYSKINIKKKKQKTPKYLIIFDDLSIELKVKSVAFLLKTFRHYKSKVIVSTQYLNDLAPDARMQFDIWLLFKGHTLDKLEKIYGDIGCNLPFDTFYDIYRKITDEPYQFLYIDKTGCQLRKNFNELIEIKN
jgi:hypothetical protein